MAPTQDDLKRAENQILVLLQDAETAYSPAQLLKQLRDHGISEYSARVAIWYLIDRNRIELTLNRMLQSARNESDVPLAANTAAASA